MLNYPTAAAFFDNHCVYYEEGRFTMDLKYKLSFYLKGGKYYVRKMESRNPSNSKIIYVGSNLAAAVLAFNKELK